MTFSTNLISLAQPHGQKDSPPTGHRGESKHTQRSLARHTQIYQVVQNKIFMTLQAQHCENVDEDNRYEKPFQDSQLRDRRHGWCWRLLMADGMADCWPLMAGCWADHLGRR